MGRASFLHFAALCIQYSHLLVAGVEITSCNLQQDSFLPPASASKPNRVHAGLVAAFALIQPVAVRENLTREKAGNVDPEVSGGTDCNGAAADRSEDGPWKVDAAGVPRSWHPPPDRLPLEETIRTVRLSTNHGVAVERRLAGGPGSGAATGVGKGCKCRKKQRPRRRLGGTILSSPRKSECATDASW